MVVRLPVQNIGCRGRDINGKVFSEPAALKVLHAEERCLTRALNHVIGIKGCIILQGRTAGKRLTELNPTTKHGN